MNQLEQDILSTAENFSQIFSEGDCDFSVAIRVWEKVRGRLLNGKEDSITFYIAGYKEHIEKGKQEKGYNVQIV